MKQLCTVLEIKHIKSSLYHSESNGCLEHWHATLTLRKYPEKHGDWDELVKYILFACRVAPHANTGYSPFELIFGRQLRGPLDVVYDGWLGGELPQSSAVEWLEKLREKLGRWLLDKESKAKEQMAHRAD